MPGFMGGMMKKDMKNFMKQALAKTKEDGDQGKVVIGSGNVYKKINNFAPKQKKSEKKNHHAPQSLKWDNSLRKWMDYKPPPLKPNLNSRQTDWSS